jgi:predicted ArsR family transcriptional regulator
MTEKNDFIQKLQGREMVNPHAIANKVNEIIDQINMAIADEKQKDEKIEDLENQVIDANEQAELNLDR